MSSTSSIVLKEDWLNEMAAPYGMSGGKTFQAKYIIPLIPEHETYVEPFCGSASILFKKDPSKNEVITDIDPDIIATLEFLKVATETDIEELKKRNWKASRSLFKSLLDAAPKTEMGKTYRFLWLRRHSFGGKSNSYAPSTDTPQRNCYPTVLDRAPEYKERLKNVTIELMDFAEAIKKYNSPTTFYYIDPPYTGNNNNETLKFSLEELIRLAEAMKTITGKWLMSNSESEEVRQHFGEYTIKELKVRRHMNQATAHDSTELIIGNYDLPELMEQEINRSIIHEIPITDLLHESFEWIPDIKGLRELARKENGHVYKVELMHPMVTDPLDIGHGPREWTIDELRKSARTLIGKDHVCFNHEHEDNEPRGNPLIKGRSVIIDAEFNDKTETLEAIIFSDSSEVFDEFKRGDLKASLEGRPRQVITNNGKETPVGSVFHGMAFVTKNNLPGDPNSNVELIETQGKRNSSLNKAEDNSRLKINLESKLLSKYITKDTLRKAVHCETLEDAQAGVEALFASDPDLPEDVKQAILDVIATAYSARPEEPPAGEQNADEPPATADTSAAQVELGKTEPRLVKKIEAVSQEFKGISERQGKAIAELKKSVDSLKDPNVLKEILNRNAPADLRRTSSKTGIKVNIAGRKNFT